MKDQHTMITGYQDLDQRQIDMINEIKGLEEQVGKLYQKLVSKGQWPLDPRWLSIGRTDLQKGFMALVRAVASPRSSL